MLAKGGDLECSSPLLALDFSLDFKVLSALAAQNTTRIQTYEYKNVTLPNKKGAPLVNCYGHSKPGQILAILSPNSATQTTLLHVLAGRKHAVKLLRTGQFLANGTRELHQIMHPGFVLAKSHHLSTSTVEEEFRFVFAMRYPGVEAERSVRDGLIQDLLSSLNLGPSKGLQIGTLPAWQVKRVALGVELLSLPNLLFVERPMTDFDRKRDWEMIKILQALQRLEVCQIIVALHRPSSEIFQQVAQHFALISTGGETLFVGHVDDALQCLARGPHSRTLQANFSAVDHLLLCAEFPNLCFPPHPGPIAGDEPVLDIAPSPHCRPRRGLWEQFKLLLARELLASVRDKRVIIIRFIATSIIMTVCAVVFLHVGVQSEATYFVGSHFGSFVYPMFLMCFGVMVPMTLVLSDSKRVLIRERSMYMYAPMPLLMAKLLPELVINLAFACEAVVILYFAAGWTGSFMIIACALFLLLESCVSYCYFFVFTFRSIVRALVLVVLVLVPQLLFLGAFVRINSLQPWLAWVHWVCTVNIALQIVSATEFRPTACGTELTCAQWDALLKGNGIVDAEVWWRNLILVLFFAVYRALGFASLQLAIRRMR